MTWPHAHAMAPAQTPVFLYQKSSSKNRDNSSCNLIISLDTSWETAPPPLGRQAALRTNSSFSLMAGWLYCVAMHWQVTDSTRTLNDGSTIPRECYPGDVRQCAELVFRGQHDLFRREFYSLLQEGPNSCQGCHLAGVTKNWAEATVRTH